MMLLPIVAGIPEPGLPGFAGASLRPFSRAWCRLAHPRSFTGTLKRIVTF